MQGHGFQPLHYIGGGDAADAGRVVGGDASDASTEQAAAHGEIVPTILRVAESVPQPMFPGRRRVGDAGGGQDFAARGVCLADFGCMDADAAGSLLNLQVVPCSHVQRCAIGQLGSR